MGSSISKIYDDMDKYSHLCKKYGEKEKELYSNHYYWLEGKDRGETTITFIEYDKQKQIKSLKYSIEQKEQELNELKSKLERLMVR